MTRNVLLKSWLKENISDLYWRWLIGKSLRSVALYVRKQTGIKVTHGTVASWLRAEYGEGATSPEAMSLQRSLLEDYEDSHLLPEVKAFVLSKLTYRSSDQIRSRHSLNQLSIYQTARDEEIFEYVMPTGNDPWTALIPAPNPKVLYLALFSLVDAIAAL